MLAEIIWKRKDAQSFARGYGVIHDAFSHIRNPMIMYSIKFTFH